MNQDVPFLPGALDRVWVLDLSRVLAGPFCTMQLAWLANVASNYLASGETPGRYGNAHPNIVPYQTFPRRPPAARRPCWVNIQRPC